MRITSASGRDKLAAMTAHLYKMLSIAEADEIVQRSISTLESFDVALLAATGYVLAEDIKAKEPLPPFPASIKVLACPNRRHTLTTDGNWTHLK